MLKESVLCGFVFCIQLRLFIWLVSVVQT